MAALARRGRRVAPFKVGPDFIDPGHHRRVTGRSSYNLDGWMLPESYNRSLFAEKSAGCDVAVVEGVMGLFDGYDGRSEAGSTAQMAKWLGLPVLLAVDARSMARSAAALAQGFERFDPALRFAGVVFNRIGSRRHLHYLREALDGAVDMPVLGGMPRDERLAMPERHLGLVTAEDHALPGETVALLADLAEKNIDMDALESGLPDGDASGARPSPASAAAPGPVRIAVARDRAFCFYYPDNLEMLEACGAETVAFSPVTDRRLPADVSGIYLGGGYPELWGEALAENRSMRAAIRSASEDGVPVYGECGGFMYLCKGLADTEGRVHPMVGCFPFSVRMDRRLRSLGYREAVLTEACLLGPAGATIRGHEFHYSHLAQEPVPWTPPTAFAVTPRAGGALERTGYRVRETLGSYLHLHFGSRPEAAASFVEACRRYRSQARIK